MTVIQEEMEIDTTFLPVYTYTPEKISHKHY